MSLDDNKRGSSGGQVIQCIELEEEKPLMRTISSASTTTTSTTTTSVVLRKRRPSRAPLACNEEGFDDMEPLLLHKESTQEGVLTNGQSPQISPYPNSLRGNTPGLRYKNLGKSGLRVSNIGIATWMLASEPPETIEAIISLAYDSGINVFDLSDAYSGPAAEIELGKILKKKGWKRTTFIIIVKIYWTSKNEEKGLSRKYIIDCVKSSLERLQLSFIDVVIIHRHDSSCPMEEIVRSMTYVINNGWAMYWGTSKWTPVEIMEAYSNCRQFNCITPIVEQAEYHFFSREKPELYMTELYNKIGVGLMTWSPLTMGFYKALGKNTEESLALAFRSSLKVWSKERSISTDEASNQKIAMQQRISREIACLAEKHGCSLTQLVIAWCLKNEAVQSMLIGPSSTAELVTFIQSLQLLPKLNTNAMNELEKILDNRPVRPPMISTLAMSAQR